MHKSAMSNCQSFFDAYGESFKSLRHPVKVIEIGSQDVNGSLRSTAPAGVDYLGVDFSAGPGVDLVLEDPYRFPLPDACADIVLSSSCFEHSEMFWLVFLEIMRILRPRGLFYLNAPSNGPFHRYPVDCWRFYPDSGNALVSWARRNGIKAALLESYTSAQMGGGWNDFVAVFLRDERHASRFARRILDHKTDLSNGLLYRQAGFVRPSVMTEDHLHLWAIQQRLAEAGRK